MVGRMQASPYTPGSVARSVPGRQAVLESFVERLSLMVDLRRLVPRVEVLYGPRGIGKTSLLRAFQAAAAERDVLTAWVTARSDERLTAQIAQAIESAVAAWPERKARRVRDAITSLEVTLGVPGVVAARARTQRTTPPETLSTRAFKRLLVDTADDADAGLMIFVDEVQSADQPGLRTLAYAWQELQSERPDLTAGVFAAGLPNSAERIAKAATFSERFAYSAIELLSDGAQVTALRDPAAEIGVAWTAEALARAVELAAGYPYAVQLYGDAAWAAAGRPDPGGTIDSSHIDEATTSVEHALDSLYAARWAAASPKQQDFLSAMASLQQDEEPVTRADIAERMSRPSASLSLVRDELVSKGIVGAAGRGKLTFTVPGFGAYVREKHPG